MEAMLFHRRSTPHSWTSIRVLVGLSDDREALAAGNAFMNESPYTSRPDPYFKGHQHRVVINQDDLLGLNVGYECHEWQYESFAAFLFDWLVEFATSFSDLQKLTHGNLMRMVTQAANTVYNTDKYRKRGEFGELLLHAILRELFDTEPAVSKLFYKSAVNDTVKGFDAVHVRRGHTGDIELWLGEVKFYKSIDEAIKSVTGEIAEHLTASKMREEFMCVGRLVNPNWEFSEFVNKLFNRNTSLDDIFHAVCIPVLLTYESDVVRDAKEVSDNFIGLLKKEFLRIQTSFKNKVPKAKVKIHLILLPLKSKEKLVSILNEKLKGLQR